MISNIPGEVLGIGEVSDSSKPQTVNSGVELQTRAPRGQSDLVIVMFQLFGQYERTHDE